MTLEKLCPCSCLICILCETVRESSAAPISTLSAGVSRSRSSGLGGDGLDALRWPQWGRWRCFVIWTASDSIMCACSWSHVVQPKACTAGTASRRLDIYFDSNVHCYVECVLTKANNQTAWKDVKKHILRFFVHGNSQTANYEILSATFAILHYQDWGSSPMQLENDLCTQCFNERVFTFLMKTKELYLGNTRISGP